MTIDVTFAENAMEIRPQFKEVIPFGKGSDGATFIPDVSEEGILSWTNNGNLPNPEPVSIVGKDGYTPKKGVDYFTDGDKEEMIARITPEKIGAAPAKAIIDRSPETEAEVRYEYGVIDQWRWVKRIDGTFELNGFCHDITVNINKVYDNNRVYVGIEALPFDVMDIEYSGYVECDEFDGLDYGSFDITLARDDGGIPNGLDIFVENIEEAVFDAMRENDMEEITLYGNVTITGRWRVDEDESD